jgi:hypothetical protein
LAFIAKLYERFSSKLNIIVIYISEAHARDEWPISHTHQTLQHKTIEDRIREANKINILNPNFPSIFCDSFGLENFESNFAAWPERLLIIRNSKLEYISTHNVNGICDWYDPVQKYCENI